MNKVWLCIYHSHIRIHIFCCLLSLFSVLFLFYSFPPRVFFCFLFGFCFSSLHFTLTSLVFFSGFCLHIYIYILNYLKLKFIYVLIHEQRICNYAKVIIKVDTNFII